MDDRPNFLAPGGDGEIVPATSLWRKGLVYTRRAALAKLQSNRQNYQILVGFKRGVPAEYPFAGFRDVYRRVAAIAKWRTSQLTCLRTGETLGSTVRCHGWRRLGENIVTAFININLRCSDQSSMEMQSKPIPTDDDLGSPGGATLEELEHLAPQQADEIYNEFDFTDPSKEIQDLVTLSYGERVEGSETVDFHPFVERAETLAHAYRALLHTLGEANSGPFRIRRREWFLASQTFVTVQICFS